MKIREREWFEYLSSAFANPRKIISVDTNSINVIRALWPELALNMKFIPNFVDQTMFFPDKARRQHEKLQVLFPRRSQVNRGSRIMDAILQQVPHDIAFYWVGEGDAEDTVLLQNLAKKDTRLTYVKDAAFDEMPAWYQQSDITVIPTIASEGTSLSCLEALACGCATISTNVGGLTDIIQDEINGRCLDPDPREIAGAINELVMCPDLLTYYQKEGYKSSQRFSLAKWEARWERVLRELGWLA